MNQVRTADAKQYQKIKQRLSLVHLVLTPLILWAVAASGLSNLLKSAAMNISQTPWLVAALYFTYFSLLNLLVDLPLGYYSSFVLEHRFGLSNESLGRWILETAKKSLLSFAFSCALILALYQIIWHFPVHWWSIAWISFIFVSLVMGRLFPVFIVPLFYKYSEIPDEALRQKILRLASRFKMPVEHVYSINLSKTTKKANAAFMGMGKTKRVVISDTLMEHFNHDEIEMVLAHELGHFVHKDIWRQVCLGAASSLAIFWIASKVMNPVAQALNYSGVEDVAAMPLLFLIFDFAFLVLMPLQNGFSRRLERQADQFAVEVIPNKDVFVSCMRKLGEVNLADPDPNALYEWFFYDHPSIGKRIKMVQDA